MSGKLNGHYPGRGVAWIRGRRERRHSDGTAFPAKAEYKEIAWHLQRLLTLRTAEA